MPLWKPSKSAPAPVLQHAGLRIPYQLEHRPRVTRRMHLELDDKGGLRVVVPRRSNPADVHRVLQSRVDRVCRFVHEARRRLSEAPHLDYLDGEQHLFLGERLSLRVRAGRKSSVSQQGGLLMVDSSNPSRDHLQRILRNWYRDWAQVIFLEGLERISGHADWVRSLPELRLRRMKRTWGSCSPRGIITLNPHLVKAPRACIDYVIAHELCHLREPNHGRGFYALQSRLYPDWKNQRQHLRSHGHIYLNE